MPLSYVATSKEYSDGTGGTTWKALREERPVTPNFDPIRQAIDSVSCSRAFVWLFTRVHGWKKKPRSTSAIRVEPHVTSKMIQSGQATGPAARLHVPWHYRGTKADKKEFNILCGRRPHL